MAWIPHPSEIVTQRATGVGDMGDVTNEVSTARFGMPDGPWVLIWLKVRFTLELAGATGNAPLAMKLDHDDKTGIYDWNEVNPWPVCGLDGDNVLTDIDWRIAAEEYPRYVYQPGQQIVFEWTNPDAAKIRWTIEVGLARAA